MFSIIWRGFPVLAAPFERPGGGSLQGPAASRCVCPRSGWGAGCPAPQPRGASADRPAGTRGLRGVWALKINSCLEQTSGGKRKMKSFFSDKPKFLFRCGYLYFRSILLGGSVRGHHHSSHWGLLKKYFYTAKLGWETTEGTQRSFINDRWAPADPN